LTRTKILIITLVALVFAMAADIANAAPTAPMQASIMPATDPDYCANADGLVLGSVLYTSIDLGSPIPGLPNLHWYVVTAEMKIHLDPGAYTVSVGDVNYIDGAPVGCVRSGGDSFAGSNRGNAVTKVTTPWHLYSGSYNLQTIVYGADGRVIAATAPVPYLLP
jgi:hypothetical protein